MNFSVVEVGSTNIDSHKNNTNTNRLTNDWFYLLLVAKGQTGEMKLGNFKTR